MALLAGASILAGGIAVAAIGLSVVTGTTPAVHAQVATLGTPPPEVGPEPSATPAPELDAEGSLLAYAACMRENGIETEDPRFDINGGLVSKSSFKSAFKDGEVDETFEAAQEVCAGLLIALKPALDPALQAEQTESALAFAQCLRDEGLDWPDPHPDGSEFAGSDIKVDKESPEFAVAFAVCADELTLGGPEGLSK